MTPRSSQAAEERILLADLAGPYRGEWRARWAVYRQLLDAFIPDYRKGDKEFGDPDRIRDAERVTNDPHKR